jgi:hypothetical protein
MSIILTNALAMHLDHPDTFDVPEVDVLAELVPGDFVKLGFRDDADGGDGGGERMWVKLTSRSGSEWTGTISNTPFWLDLSFGDEVRFGPENILDAAPGETVDS